MSMNRTDAIQISRRYATAMFDLAVEAKKEKILVEDFSVLANAITKSDELSAALALSAATQKQLSQSLADAAGKKVKLKLKEDTSVLGGVKIELGSLLLDATLAGALNTMREQLLAPTN